MKNKTMFLSCLVGMIILAMGYEYSQAQQKADTPSPKIGIVSILKIFRNCKRSAAHNTKINTEQSKIRAVVSRLNRIEQYRAGFIARLFTVIISR